MSNYKKFWVGGAINLAAGLGTAAYGYAKEREALRKMAQAEEDAAGPVRSQAARQRIARMEGDAQSATDAALRAEATAASALGESGGYGAQIAATPQLQRTTQEAVMAGLDRFGTTGAQIGALKEQQDLASVNQRSSGTLDRLQRAADVGRAATLGGISQAVGGVAQIAGGLPKKSPAQAGAATAIESKGMGAMAPSSGAPSSGISRQIPSVDLGAPSVQTAAPSALDRAYQAAQGVNQRAFGSPKRGSSDFDFIPGYDLLDINPSKDKFGFSEGGMFENEEAVETPGEFNHDTNPIDIIQEGEKIGEMTGGEYIFNPEQAETLRELSMQGDSPLHQFIRELLSKEEFNEVEDED